MMTLQHDIKTIEDIKIFCQCPCCGGELIKPQIEDKTRKKLIINNAKLLTYKETEQKIKNDNYTIDCPHCNQFKIIYINQLHNIRNVTKDTNNKEVTNNVKDFISDT